MKDQPTRTMLVRELELMTSEARNKLSERNSEERQTIEKEAWERFGLGKLEAQMKEIAGGSITVPHPYRGFSYAPEGKYPYGTWIMEQEIARVKPLEEASGAILEQFQVTKRKIILSGMDTDFAELFASFEKAVSEIVSKT